MRIAEIRFAGINVTPKTNWSFVVVRTEDGRAGTGECTLANHEAALAVEVARLDAALRGADARGGRVLDQPPVFRVPGQPFLQPQDQENEAAGGGLRRAHCVLLASVRRG